MNVFKIFKNMFTFPRKCIIITLKGEIKYD